MKRTKKKMYQSPFKVSIPYGKGKETKSDLSKKNLFCINPLWER